MIRFQKPNQVLKCNQNFRDEDKKKNKWNSKVWERIQNETKSQFLLKKNLKGSINKPPCMNQKRVIIMLL